MSKEREFVYEQRDLDVLMTAAGQVSVAVENARLFAEEQRRSRQLAFLNNISRTAISSDDPGCLEKLEVCLREIRDRARTVTGPGHSWKASAQFDDQGGGQITWQVRGELNTAPMPGPKPAEQAAEKQSA